MKSLQAWLEKPGVMELREVNLPEPAPYEVQVKCLANGICMAEVSTFRGTEPPWGSPLGHEGIGVVTKVGRDVKSLKEGDCVTTTSWATYQNQAAAHTAVFRQVPADPAVFITEPSACVVTAWYSYRIVPGDRVLVLGAGYMGLLNVQALGRSPLAELVVADLKPANLKLAAAAGATEVINSGTAKGKARLEALKDQPFDLVVEAAGAEQTLQLAGPLTRRGGRLSIFAWHHGNRTVDFGLWHVRGLQVLNSSPMIGTDWNINPMQRAAHLLEAGVFDQRRLITHRHPFAQVQAALELAAARPPEYCKGVLLFA